MAAQADVDGARGKNPTADQSAPLCCGHIVVADIFEVVRKAMIVVVMPKCHKGGHAVAIQPGWKEKAHHSEVPQPGMPAKHNMALYVSRRGNCVAALCLLSMLGPYTSFQG